MNPSDFHSNSAGFCRKMPGGYHAFIPNGLPPEIPLDWGLAGLLSEADRAMAELSGAGSLLPNPHLLIRPYLRREAILSSRIENTIAELDELVLFEVDPDDATTRPDVREVSNYVRALDHGLKSLATLPISSRLLFDMHAILLEAVRGGESHKTPGEFRRSQNWIGRPGVSLREATFVPPPPDDLPNLLSAWENYLHADSAEPVLIKCALLHYQFESIHPYLDGNGRIGRLLVTLFLCSQKCLAQPLLYLSGFFDDHRDEYYRLLLEVSQKGNWREWIEYFLRGVRHQAKAALEDTRQLLELYERFRSILKKAKRPPGEAARVLDEIFATPVISIPAYVERHQVSYPTASKAVEFWSKHGLLEEMTGYQRNRLFAAKSLVLLGSGRTKSSPQTT